MENLNEKQQIEEMAEVLKNYTERNYIMASHVILDAYAEELYKAGFKSQSEGEWVVEAYPVDSDEVIIIPYKEHQHNEPYCSICGEYALLNGGEEYVTSNFCPNCGARMKGGAEYEIEKVEEE